MNDNPFAEKFPDLQPGKRPSKLGAVNGFGTTLVGHRAFDPDTGTYVVTHMVTALFIPIIALASYRVARADNGWYCLGKVPLSGVARAWNLFLVLAILGAVGGTWWSQHIQSPEYLAGRRLDEADQAAAAGQGGHAAQLYREVMDTPTSKSAAASIKFAALVEAPVGPPSEAAGVYAVAVDLHRENRCPVPNLFEMGAALADRLASEDPKSALALLEVIASLAPNPAAELNTRKELLEKLFARAPTDPEIASRLAAVYEATGNLEKCEKLLAPFESQLGTLDGAAILGRIHAGRGRFDQAHALLAPYVTARLPRLRDAEQGLTSQIKAAEDRVVATLKSGKAPGFDYARYDRTTKDQQGAMIEAYIGEQIKGDVGLRSARQKLIAQQAVVGAVLDLGLVQLQRAQALADPAARKAELEAAEKTFLSVRGFAGQSDEYRQSLGQVYYWLGRPADGKKLFDELLTSRGRSTEVLLRVAHTLREVGDTTEARRLGEEAYNREGDVAKKQEVASFRALVRTDMDDSILWLSRANQESVSVQAELAAARGHKAHQEGKDEEAAGHYRRALDAYAKLPDSAAKFNNSALAHFELADVTQDREELIRGLDKLDRAIALKPSDSILLLNGASMAIRGAIRDTVGTEIDFRALKSVPGWDSLGYLYRTPAERTAVMSRLSGHPGAVKARSYSEKLIILAPKRDDSYQLLTVLFDQTRDAAGLKDLAARAEKAEIDSGDDSREYREFISGQSDVKKLAEVRASVTRATTSLTAARPVGGRTLAAAVGRYVRAKISAWTMGEAIDADELVKLADEAFSATPSAGAEATLETALLLRAHLSLIKGGAGYDALAKKTHRSFGVSLVHYVLSVDGPYRERAAANPDVKRLAALSVDAARRDPLSAGSSSWVLVRAVQPDEAKAFGDAAKADGRRQYRHRIAQILSPYSAATAINEYFDLLLDGKEAEANKAIAQLAAKDIPTP